MSKFLNQHWIAANQPVVFEKKTTVEKGSTKKSERQETLYVMLEKKMLSPVIQPLPTRPTHRRLQNLK